MSAVIVSTSDRQGGAVNPAPWPYAPPVERPMPLTLPGGKPWPLITVVTPSFNQGQFLEQTLLSVLNQNYPNLEYIVMDGGSSDESSGILQRYGSRLAFWASEKDRGQCHAINKGFARATGDIVTWVNSDDMLAPGALAAVAMAFHNSGADLVAGICQLHRDGVLLNQHLTSCPDGPLPLDQLLDQEHCWERGQFFYQPEVFFTRDIWQRAGGRLDESLYFSLDYELWLRFATLGARLKVLGTPLALYRVHEAQKTFSIEQYRPELRKVRERFLAANPAASLSRGENVPPLGCAAGAETRQNAVGEAFAIPKTAASTSSLPIKDRLRIALVNDVGSRFGAGIAHERLAQSLRRAGHEVMFLAAKPTKVLEDQQAPGLEALLLKQLRSREPDVVVVGNLHAARMGAPFLARISAEWPTVFVLHDAWLLTGRCAYTGTCGKYLTGCDESCPTSEEYPPLPLPEIKPAWEAKRKLMANSPGLVLAANSAWMLRQIELVRESMRPAGLTPRCQARMVHYGLPLETFKPRDQQLCREMLRLPQDKFLLLFSCTNVADVRKGTTHLVEALKQLALPNLVSVCLGTGAQELSSQVPNLLPVGYSSDPYHQALLFSAVDLFVGPSLEEAFGQVFIEAAACGTPSVGYPVGGVPEALGDGLSGRLTAAVDPAALAAAITELYQQPQLRRNLGWWGSLYVRTHFSFEASYHTLHQALREAVAQKGTRLTPSICFKPQPAALPAVEYMTGRAPAPESSAGLPGGLLVTETPDQVEARIERYFQERLDRYRRGRLPWIFQPQAWWARWNRNALRKGARARRDVN